MSTTITSHSSEQQTSRQSPQLVDASEASDRYSPEVEHAMIRAQQRAKLFVNQTAPQSVNTSPNNSPSAKRPAIVWHTSHIANSDRVKSSLKLRPGLQRANSEPSNKSVHFSTTNLVDIRQFKRTQSPSAVGRKPSFYYAPSTEVSEDSIDMYDEDDDEEEDDETDEEDDVASENDNTAKFYSRFPLIKKINFSKHKHAGDENQGWTLLTPGFVPHKHGRLPGSQRPICYLETLQLSSDPTCLKATIYVRNIAFEKYVALRYTISNWDTFSETQGVFSSDVRKFDRDAGYDRFNITIPLSQFHSAQLNNSSLKFCVHYVANNIEYWDSNGGTNYEIFLRNSKLASGHSTHGSSKKITTNVEGHKENSPISDALQPRIRASSIPQIALNLNDEDYDTNDDEDYHSLSTTEFMKIAGIPLRSRYGDNKRDPFINRYSFETAFSASPKTPQDYPDAPIFTVEGDQIVAENQSSKQSAAQIRPVPDLWPSTASTKTTLRTRERDEGHKPTSTNSWESDSYKDFVSKYCFYTPRSKSSQPVSSLNRNAVVTDSTSPASETDRSVDTKSTQNSISPVDST